MFPGFPQSRCQDFVPLDQRSENESSGSIHFQITMEITEFCISGFTAQCAVCIYGIYGACLKWMLPELLARALVFRPLVKENEALGTRLGFPARISDMRNRFSALSARTSSVSPSSYTNTIFFSARAFLGAKFGKTRNVVGTRAAGECVHSFFEFSQTFTSVSITR